MCTLRISTITHSFHGGSARAALDANVASSLHEVGGTDISRLILPVFVQKEASEVLHGVIDLTRDFLVRKEERAICSSTGRVIGAVERGVSSYP